MSYKLLNAEERESETFQIPDRETRKSLSPGDYAKVIFEPGERMWVKIRFCYSTNSHPSPTYSGLLANTPVLDVGVKENDIIEFGPEHIIDFHLGVTVNSHWGRNVMGLDYAWLNHSKREYIKEERWYRSGRCGGTIAWVFSHQSGHRWEPEDKVELVITDSDGTWECIIMHDAYGFSDAKKKWTDVKSIPEYQEWMKDRW